MYRNNNFVNLDEFKVKPNNNVSIVGIGLKSELDTRSVKSITSTKNVSAGQFQIN